MNTSRDYDYRDLYTEELVQRVARRYAGDIERFGYGYQDAHRALLRHVRARRSAPSALAGLGSDEVQQRSGRCLLDAALEKRAALAPQARLNDLALVGIEGLPHSITMWRRERISPLSSLSR